MRHCLETSKIVERLHEEDHAGCRRKAAVLENALLA